MTRDRGRGDRGSLLGFLFGTGLLTFANGTYSLLVGPTVEAHGHTASVIGVIAAAGSLTSLLVRVPAGAAYRSARAFNLILGGSVLAALGYGLFATASAAPALGALSALQGAGFAVATTAAMAGLIERRPAQTHAGSLMGLYTGSIGAGYALAGLVGGPLADAAGLSAALSVAAAAAVCSGWITAAALARFGAPSPATDEPTTPSRGWLRGMPPEVWLGFAVAVYINLVTGGMTAFFPVYALGLGLTLSQVGFLSGIHGGLASAVRFGAGTIHRWVSYRSITLVTVSVASAAVASLALPRGFVPLAILIAVAGAARGVLRVVSGAIVMESVAPSPRLRGRASGIYLAGLDLGNTLGPLIGGFVSEAVGLRWAFPVLGVVPAVLFLALSAPFDLRRTGPVLASGRATPEAP